MKTLDEVIEANECCDHGEPDSRCEDCPYNGIGSCCLERESDALHYLKLLKAHCDRVQNQIEDLREEYRPNEPLSWDELKGMEGKPVWVEALLYKQWAVIAYVGSDHIRFEGANLYAPESRVYMGDDNGWQAYRKERV